MIPIARGSTLAGVLWLAGCAHDPPAPLPDRASTLPSPRAAASHVPFVSPSSYEAFIRAELDATRGEHARAVEAYQAAIELGDADPFLIAQLALALDRSGRPDAAEAELDRALARQPSSEALLLASARIARRAGRQARALGAYARAQEVASSPATALERVAYLRELGGEERSLEALKALASQHAGQHRSGVRDRLRIALELALARRSGSGRADGQLVGCARDWLALGGGDAVLSRRAAQTLLERGHAALALELLAVVPASEADTPLRLRATLALGRSAECEHLLSSMPLARWAAGDGRGLPAVRPPRRGLTRAAGERLGQGRRGQRVPSRGVGRTQPRGRRPSARSDRPARPSRHPSGDLRSARSQRPSRARARCRLQH
jgi:tetratricopeptide (TPR) repeat protein